MKVERKERGWPGHFCAVRWCNFRRNTLLECGKIRIVVSTVGAYQPPPESKNQEIGLSRYYETMAFHAQKEGRYWDADVSRQVHFNSRWWIPENSDQDEEANEMHEKVVAELTAKMKKGKV